MTPSFPRDGVSGKPGGIQVAGEGDQDLPFSPSAGLTTDMSSVATFLRTIGRFEWASDLPGMRRRLRHRPTAASRPLLPVERCAVPVDPAAPRRVPVFEARCGYLILSDWLRRRPYCHAATTSIASRPVRLIPSPASSSTTGSITPVAMTVTARLFPRSDEARG